MIVEKVTIYRYPTYIDASDQAHAMSDEDYICYIEETDHDFIVHVFKDTW